VRLLAADLPDDARRQALAVALTHRHPAAQVRQRERPDPVSAEAGAKQREQRLVLRYRHELSGAQRTAARRVTE